MQTYAEMLRASDAVLRQGLTHKNPLYRYTAALAVGKRNKTDLTEDLIDLVADPYEGVRQAARRSLIAMSKGEDFGPLPDAETVQREKASNLWREWWQKKKK